MNHSVVGLDIAKNAFHLYSLGPDNTVFNKKLKGLKMCRRQEAHRSSYSMLSMPWHSLSPSLDRVEVTGLRPSPLPHHR